MSGYWRHLCLSIALFAAVPLLAAETDPPGRVGRISLADEGAQLRIGDSVAAGGAAFNWPLTTGAQIETTGEARAEARIGSTTLHLDGGTSLEFVELSDERIWMRLNRGSVVLGIRSPEHAAELALDTPQGRLRFETPGSYRADVAGGTTAFSVYQGAAYLEDIGLTVRPGERILLPGGTDRNHLLGNATNDAFRQWSLNRDQLAARGGKQYISPEMTGHEELERHGNWQETSEYGPAWFPQGMPPGWAPYRQGRWVWVPPWGWTWIDHALGLRPVSLRPLDTHRQQLGLDTRGIRGQTGLRSRTDRLAWPAGLERVFLLWLGAGHRLVPARAAGNLLPALQIQPSPRAQYQRNSCHRRLQDRQRDIAAGA